MGRICGRIDRICRAPVCRYTSTVKLNIGFLINLVLFYQTIFIYAKTKKKEKF